MYQCINVLSDLRGRERSSRETVIFGRLWGGRWGMVNPAPHNNENTRRTFAQFTQF